MRRRKWWRWRDSYSAGSDSDWIIRLQPSYISSEVIMAKTNIACAQFDCRLGDPKANRDKMIASIRAAAARDAKLVMFPECALTGYAFDSLKEAVPFAERLDG